MTRTRRPLSRVTINAAADLFTRGFAGYLVKLSIDSVAMERMIATDSIDLGASLVVDDGDADIGLALVARRANNCRLAAMAIVPTARRAGHGRWLLEQILADANERRDASIRLECIETNERALVLYGSAGFEIRRRLVGFDRPETASCPRETVELEEVSVGDVGAVLQSDTLELPWQLDAKRLTAYCGPAQAYRLDGAHAVIERRENKVTLLSLWVPPKERRRGAGSRLLAALFAEHPDAVWSVPPLVPEGLIDAFMARHGFVVGALSQLEMERRLG